MAALTNTITTADTLAALDVQASLNFMGEYDKLAEILGIVTPEVVAAGTAMRMLKINGTLTDGTVSEGDEVPLSKYSAEYINLDPIALKKYRKMTTAEAILKGGFENAVMATDQKMLSHVRSDIVNEFFTFLAKGEGEAGGTNLQAALADADARLQIALEENGDEGGAFVHFVNPLDASAYLGTAQVTTQTAFGMTYLESFLGVQNVVMTAKVPQGTVYVTPSDNLHMYAIDFGSLAQAGLVYNVQAGSIIGVAHEAEYSRVSGETHIVTGATLFAEVVNYIFKSTITPAA